MSGYWQDHADGRGWHGTRVDVSVISAPESEPRCEQPTELVVVDGRYPSRMKLALRCGERWSETVVARARLHAEVLVAARDLPAGAALDEDSLRREARDVSATPEAIGALDAVQGFVARRALREGTLLQARLLREPVLVRRGQAVRIVARHGGAIAVESAGESLGQGKRGDTVRVRNRGSGRVIEARVSGPAEVEPLK